MDDLDSGFGSDNDDSNNGFRVFQSDYDPNNGFGSDNNDPKNGFKLPENEYSVIKV